MYSTIDYRSNTSVKSFNIDLDEVSLEDDELLVLQCGETETRCKL